MALIGFQNFLSFVQTQYFPSVDSFSFSFDADSYTPFPTIFRIFFWNSFPKKFSAADLVLFLKFQNFLPRKAKMRACTRSMTWHAASVKEAAVSHETRKSGCNDTSDMHVAAVCILVFVPLLEGSSTCWGMVREQQILADKEKSKSGGRVSPHLSSCILRSRCDRNKERESLCEREKSHYSSVPFNVCIWEKEGQRAQSVWEENTLCVRMFQFLSLSPSPSLCFPLSQGRGEVFPAKKNLCWYL